MVNPSYAAAVSTVTTGGLAALARWLLCTAAPNTEMMPKARTALPAMTRRTLHACAVRLWQDAACLSLHNRSAVEGGFAPDRRCRRVMPVKHWIYGPNRLGEM